MDAIIRDVNTGEGASVTDRGRLKTYTMTETEAQNVSEDHAQAFSARITQAPTAGDDCIAFFENTSDEPLIITDITIMDVAGDLEFYIKLGDKGSRNAANDVTPVCLNSGKGSVAGGTFEQGADLDGGAAALTGGQETHRWNLLAAESSKDLKIPGGKIILEKNQTVSFWSSAIQEVDWTTFFHYHQ